MGVLRQSLLQYRHRPEQQRGSALTSAVALENRRDSLALTWTTIALFEMAETVPRMCSSVPWAQRMVASKNKRTDAVPIRCFNASRCQRRVREALCEVWLSFPRHSGLGCLQPLAAGRRRLSGYTVPCPVLPPASAAAGDG